MQIVHFICDLCQSCQFPFPKIPEPSFDAIMLAGLMGTPSKREIGIGSHRG